MAKTASKTPSPAGTSKAAPTAQQKANARAVAAFARQLGVSATIEGVQEEPVAAVESTVLAQGAGTLYHEGPLAVGVAVFNDEALTMPTDEADYEAEDGRIITVAGGVVEALTEAETEEGTEDTSNAALLRRLEALEAKDAQSQNTMAALSQQLEKFNRTVPAAPRPLARAAAGSQIDPKAKPVAKGKAEHHHGL